MMKAYFLVFLALVFIGCSSKRNLGTHERPLRPFPEKIAQTITDTIRPNMSIDTITWVVIDTVSRIEEKVETIQTLPQDKPPISKDKILKNQYQIAILLPFMSHESSPSRVSMWAMDFYLGMKIALQNESGIVINVRDTRGEEKILKDILAERTMANTDVIVGAYRSNNTVLLANYVSEHPHMTMVSPYTANTKLVQDNNQYIQTTPGLETHLLTIFNQIRLQRRDHEHVLFLYQNNDAGQSVQLIWDELTQRLRPDEAKMFFKVKMPDTEIKINETIIDSLAAVTDRCFFVLPFWEEKITSTMLRRLITDKNSRTFTVFGLPQWQYFDQLTSAHLESLNAHITSHNFYSLRDSEIAALRLELRQQYGHLINQDVVWGYVNGKFISNALKNHGTAFHRFITNEKPGFQQGSLNIVQRKSSDGKFLLNENQSVQVLKFMDGQFLPK